MYVLCGCCVGVVWACLCVGVCMVHVFYMVNNYLSKALLTIILPLHNHRNEATEKLPSV